MIGHTKVSEAPEQSIVAINLALDEINGSLRTIAMALGTLQGMRPAEDDATLGGVLPPPAFTKSLMQEECRLKKLGIPEEVLRQIRAEGYNPEALPDSELQIATQGYLADGIVFDDKEGGSFLDKITLTPDEEKARKDKNAIKKAPDDDDEEDDTPTFKYRRLARATVRAVTRSPSFILTCFTLFIGSLGDFWRIS